MIGLCDFEKALTFSGDTEKATLTAYCTLPSHDGDDHRLTEYWDTCGG